MACGWCTGDLGGAPEASSVLPGKVCIWTCRNIGAAVGRGEGVAVLEDSLRFCGAQFNCPKHLIQICYSSVMDLGWERPFVEPEVSSSRVWLALPGKASLSLEGS